MNEEIEITNQQRENKEKSLANLKPFVKGESGNPAGRPKGKTIKEMVRQHLDDNPEELKEFVKHFIKENRELAWQMLEGRPSQQTDITSAGKQIPILGGITQTEKKDEE